MNYSIDRYNEAHDSSPDQTTFVHAFIAVIAAKFDAKLDEREWDDALAKAAAYSNRTRRAAA